MVNLIIWGIRTGFEGILYQLAPPPSQINTIIRDVFFRTVSDKARPANYFILNRMNGHCLVTIVYTDIFEQTPTSRREGFVSFTLVLPQNQAFLKSPLDTLRALTQFYKASIGNGNRNNFTDDQIRQILEPLSFGPMPYSENRLSAFSYFENEQDIDSFLMCDTPFCNHTELLLLPVSLKTRLSLSDTHTLIDLSEIEHQYNLQQKRIADEKVQLEKNQKLANIEEGDIRKRMQTGDMDAAFQAWYNSEVKQYFSTALANDMTSYRLKKQQEEADNQKRKQDDNTIKKLNQAIENGWSDQEIESLYNSIHFKSDLPEYIKNKFSQIKEKQHHANVKRLKEQEIKLQKKKRKQKLIIITCISATISFIGLAFALGWLDSASLPSSQSTTETEEIDTTRKLLNPEIDNLDTKVLSKKDSLLEGHAVQVFGDTLGILDNKFVKYDEATIIWTYGSKEDHVNQEVTTAESKIKLMRYFDLVMRGSAKSTTHPNGISENKQGMKKNKEKLPDEKFNQLINKLGDLQGNKYPQSQKNKFYEEYEKLKSKYEMTEQAENLWKCAKENRKYQPKK